MFRFLLTGRWLALGLVAVVVAVVCVRLGGWQLHRLDERRADNATIEVNSAAPPVPIARAVSVGSTPTEDQEWRRVSVSGRYDAADQLLVRYQNRGALRGVDVVVPMLLGDGSAVLVDRGFFESPAGTPDPATVPAPPPGRVDVTGWLRLDSDAPAAATRPIDGTVRAVVAGAVAPSVDAPLRGGWVQALSESPTGGTGLLGPEQPETDMGPHLFYAMQWFLFGFLALLAYGWFAYDEVRPPRRRGAAEASVVEHVGRA